MELVQLPHYTVLWILVPLIEHAGAFSGNKSSVRPGSERSLKTFSGSSTEVADDGGAVEGGALAQALARYVTHQFQEGRIGKEDSDGGDDDKRFFWPSSESERERIEKHVFFMLYKGGNILKDGSRVRMRNLKDLELSNFDPEAPTKIYIHAYMNTYLIGGGALFLPAYFRSKRYEKLNVILVDWSDLANSIGVTLEDILETGLLSHYLSWVKLVEGVGKYIGEFVAFLVEVAGGKWDDMHLIGHSLGAQVAGSVGKSTGGRVGRITGLDPAGPCFETYIHLCKRKYPSIQSSDAQFVDIIHTDSEILGTKKGVGHVDFYPNGGVVMPGCDDGFQHFGLPPILGGVCSHLKVVLYMEESILAKDGPDFYSYNCESYELFKNGECKTQAVAFMGDGCDPKSVRGKYYLQTNANPPYAQGNGLGPRKFFHYQEYYEDTQDYN